ncbi:SDR family NAD(P)-dependent oxidoreductase [Eubacteriaceae bacterium ES3]|nr:SDR family NAD(P)-dependent oxidoreductase [Eubacteriaceae bacterium ES3]
MASKLIFLVTGAAGHLGRVVTQKLIQKGERVRALVLAGEKLLPQNAKIYYGDVRDKNSLRPFFEHEQGEVLVVIHCAGIVSIASKYSQDLYDVNVTGTRNITDLCLEYRVSKLVYVSSVHAIEAQAQGIVMTETNNFDPNRVLGQYAKTKAEATAYVLAATEQNLDTSVVHPSGIIGPFDYGCAHMTAMIIDFCKHRLTSGISGGYDFVDVRDVADGIIAACDRGASGDCYILSNRYYTVREILRMLSKITGRRRIKSFLPIWFVKMTAPMAEVYYKIRRKPPLFTAYSIETLQTNANFSHVKASKELGYHTRPMMDTLADTVSWLKENGRI